MKRIWLLFLQKTNNQPTWNSHMLRWWWNTVVKARLCICNIFIMLYFSPLFCNLFPMQQWFPLANDWLACTAMDDTGLAGKNDRCHCYPIIISSSSICGICQFKDFATVKSVSLSLQWLIQHVSLDCLELFTLTFTVFILDDNDGPCDHAVLLLGQQQLCLQLPWLNPLSNLHWLSVAAIGLDATIASGTVSEVLERSSVMVAAASGSDWMCSCSIKGSHSTATCRTIKLSWWWW